MPRLDLTPFLQDELKAAETNKPTDQQLALKLIKHAQTMSVKGLEGIITTWKNAQVGVEARSLSIVPSCAPGYLHVSPIASATGL